MRMQIPHDTTFLKKTCKIDDHGTSSCIHVMSWSWMMYFLVTL